MIPHPTNGLTTPLLGSNHAPQQDYTPDVDNDIILGYNQGIGSSANLRTSKGYNHLSQGLWLSGTPWIVISR
ncbi:hypothetical protein SPLC1_S102290 [Arthrospira platensis C1]|nr:hypothetical protein SPLC1_S102290 [Arthrospira platensis C1]